MKNKVKFQNFLNLGSFTPVPEEYLKIKTFFSLNYPATGKGSTLLYNIVTCHLPRGSKLQWRDDMCGGLPSLQPVGPVGRDNILNKQGAISLIFYFIYKPNTINFVKD